jgi:hypothetical protein
MMSKTDYEIVAASIRESRQAIIDGSRDAPETRGVILGTLTTVTTSLADRFAKRDPKFQRERFEDLTLREPEDG